jgi:CSLREA domain-containing protein
MTSLPTPSTSRRAFSLALLAAALVALVAAPTAATSYNIATFADDAVVNGNCTLREALRAADGNVAVDACPAGSLDDSIVLPSGTYSFNGQEAISGGGSLSVTSVTLNPFDVTVNLLGAGRFLDLWGGGSYVLGGLAISKGVVNSGNPTGGALRAADVNLRILNFRFVSNTADSAAGPLGAFGGAVNYVAQEAGAGRSLTMANGTFFGNHVTGSSGGGGGAAVRVALGNRADFRDVTFLRNAVSVTDGGYGAGLELWADQGGVASCVRCSFLSNSALGSDEVVGGAALFTLGGTASMVDGRFIGNSASATDGGLETAALFVRSGNAGSVDLERLFVDFNLGEDGSSSQDVYLEPYGGSTVSLVDSQLTFGAASGLYAFAYLDGIVRLGHLTIADYPTAGARFSILGTSQAALQNSIVAFNPAGHDLEVLAGTLSQTTNFVGGNPLFFDEPNANYHLAATSPAIDAGTASVVTFRLADLDHRSRRAGVRTDIGCYEYNALFADNFEVGDLGAWGGHAP